MKNRWKHVIVGLFVSVVLAQGAARANAETKFGHIDSELVLANMPQTKKAEAQLATFRADLAKQIEAAQKKIQKHYETVMAQAQAGKLTPADQNQAEASLQKEQSELEAMVAANEKRLVSKRQELFSPVVAALNAAVAAVAKEKGYSFIFEKTAVLYAEPAADVTEFVKAKLAALPAK
ncbi:MAG TPA: OmpH family outer membrane protein [Kofleriaceae bacterium]|mgnify:CR=1 FL=1|nr:OmpH family outer membrane protein [Kofleriaceae bacterium]